MENLDLLGKIGNRSARVCVVGLGYVGLPLLKLISQAGYYVCGLDSDEAKIHLLSQGSFISSYTDPNYDYGQHALTTSWDEVNLWGIDIWIVAVPTPINHEDNSPDYNPLDEVFTNFFGKTSLSTGQEHVMVCVESTVDPGFCASIPDRYDLHLHLSNYKIESTEDEDNLIIAFSPERVDPGNNTHNIGNTPKIVAAPSGYSLECASLFYGSFIRKIHIMNCTTEAEFAKLYENCFRAVNIAFVNQMADLANSLNLSFTNILKAASTKPFGFMPFHPGIGVGGHCIPVDPYYLLEANTGENMSILQEALRVNHERPDSVVHLVNYLMPTKKVGRGIILVLGLTYKADIDDLRESPAMRIFEELCNTYEAYAYDPYVPNGLTYKTLPRLHRADLAAASLVLILVPHEEFKLRYDYIANHSRHVIDCAGIYPPKVLSNVTSFIS